MMICGGYIDFSMLWFLDFFLFGYVYFFSVFELGGEALV